MRTISILSTILSIGLTIALTSAASRAQGPFSDCGQLVQGVSCVLYAADGGGQYILSTLGGHVVGDRFHVDGTLDPGCISFCLQGNGCIQVSLIGSCDPGIAVCAGDGVDPTVTTPCPCANDGAPGHGCANSANAAGALIQATGTVANDDVVLHGSGMPATSGAIYLKGDAYTASGIVFGDGIRCADGVLFRLGAKTNSGGSSQYPAAGDPTLSVRGGTPVGSGLVATYQVYYRNAAAFCTTDTFNVSNARQITW